ncbi:MAG: peptidylprolyl isomerase [Leptolyngbya sp. UWPOB_LEPTO1]|uniref:peptidylprolyl isomerase n=1 Tax=Leptolyngbya sp. UWPOB_LEPTO1 TaxID=2815653 RepID=UPI001AD1E908|nr:peptidylprolyl isomerase [Leptolyngbya sp. UWPOB_LEPTO1]MBN8563059.1 peptidylprolyl isomerase [Leptolyngbya sp. UWPOB_LEPTO1]
MTSFKGETIHSETIIATLKKTLQLKEICRNISYQKIIDQAIESREITVTPEEIQAEADHIRYENRLFRSADTFAWLNDQLVTPEEWEAGIRDRLLTKKLAQILFAKEADRFFTENQREFDQVLLYRIVVPYQQLAQEIAYQIQEDEISFYEAAHLYDSDDQRRFQCGYEGKLYRWNLKPELSALVFSATPGQVIGPIEMDQASHLLLVEEFIPAEFTPERQQEILDRMFNEWLTTELNYLIHT